MTNKSYTNAEAWRARPLVQDDDADTDHGNRVTSLIVYGHELNRGLNLSRLFCRVGTAQAVNKTTNPVPFEEHEFIEYLDGIFEANPDTRVWNFSLNINEHCQKPRLPATRSPVIPKVLILVSPPHGKLFFGEIFHRILPWRKKNLGLPRMVTQRSAAQDERQFFKIGDSQALAKFQSKHRRRRARRKSRHNAERAEIWRAPGCLLNLMGKPHGWDHTKESANNRFGEHKRSRGAALFRWNGLHRRHQNEVHPISVAPSRLGLRRE